MLVDRLAGAAGDEAERGVAQHAHAVPAAVHEVEDVRVGAVLEQHRVELEVELGEAVRVEVVERLAHPLVDLAGRAMSSAVRAARESAVAAPSTMASVCMVCRYSVASMPIDLRADVALERHQALGLEPADGLAHGHDGDVELLGDLAEHQPVAGHVAAVVDALAEEAVGPLGLALGAHRLASAIGFAGVVARAPLGVHREQAVDVMPLRDLLGDPGVLALLRDGLVGDLLDEGRRDHDDAVAVATMTSPGCTAAPPHAMVTSLPRHVPAAEHRGVRPCEYTGMSTRRRVGSRATPPSVTMPAAPRTWARRARMSPTVPVPLSPRASMTSTSPSFDGVEGALLRVEAAAVGGEQVLAVGG